MDDTKSAIQTINSFSPDGNVGAVPNSSNSGDLQTAIQTIKSFSPIDNADKAMGVTTPSSYTVQPGDNLAKIAAQMGTSIDKISGYKSGDPNLIYPGEKLTLPHDTATKGALLAGADPTDLAWARQQLGKELYPGYCQSFVRQATSGATNGGSALIAWQNAAKQGKAVPSLSGVQPGDLVYFSGSDGNGHTGIYSGNGKFISATQYGSWQTDPEGNKGGNVREEDINDWSKRWGEPILGYVPMGGSNGNQ